MKTLIIGASSNPERYSYKAAQMLTKYGHEIVLIGTKEGVVANTKILIGTPEVTDIDTITLYLSAANQVAMYDYILKLKPRRIIFNPGAENRELEILAQQQHTETTEACTLVLLSTGQY